jgi:uncharacterized protein (DUF433 family)
MVATTYRYIVRRAGMHSGHPIVERTRIGAHDVVAMVKTGASVDQVATSFPPRTRAEVHECLAYHEDHRNDSDQLVLAQTDRA